MEQLQVYLFGKFSACWGGRAVAWQTGKAQELFCYLLLHRAQPCSRDVLASLLWEHSTTAQAKAYLRKTLWQLHRFFKDQGLVTCEAAAPLLLASREWIQCNPEFDLWLDADVLEESYKLVEGLPGERLTAEQARRLRDAIDLYDADLLENFYQDWCLYERERLRHFYLIMLDKLAAHYEHTHQFEVALSYAERILWHDPAREHTHRQLMRLRYRSGDRTGAVRQYEHCVRALRDDLDIEPAEATRRLHKRLQQGHVEALRGGALPPEAAASASPQVMLRQLKETLSRLADAHVQVCRQVATLEAMLGEGSAAPPRRPLRGEVEAVRALHPD